MAKETGYIGDIAPFNGASPWLFAVREEFMHETPRVLKHLLVKDLDVELRAGKQSLWVTVRWPSGGGVLLRTAYCPEGSFEVSDIKEHERSINVLVNTAIGVFNVNLEVLDVEKTLMHWTVRLTPAGELNFPFWPVDLYQVDENWDPLGVKGIVHAAQRGPAVGFVYLTILEPEAGSVLYLQNLTALNEYCEKTHTTPDTRVGGSWPELGYTPPIAERKPIPAGEDIVISDAYVRFTHTKPENTGDVAHSFLDMLSEIYYHLPRPGAVYQDWFSLAKKTVHDLGKSDACTTVKNGYRYLNAYVGTGNRRPESLVQLSVLLPLLEYEDWSGKSIPLVNDLKENLTTFYDHKIKCVMRYPEALAGHEVEDVDEKKAWEIDSWYLYHPLANLGRLAERGDETAHKLFLDSLEYAMKVAHHFDYKWPVLFQADTLEVIREAPTPKLGETDVPGLYAYVMLQARDLTGDNRYFEEAVKACKSLVGLQFSIGYQFNNTAWAACALARLWKETGDHDFLDLSYVCIASILQNAFLWDCNYGYAKHYTTFFGITPLREGNYIALYEEFEILAALQDYLRIMAHDAPDSIKMLLSEFSKYSLDGKYCYYPMFLPEEALSKETRNGYIDRNLAVPLEDIYEGWQQAGQVGQEVYGAGAAPGFVVRAYNHIKGTPFMLWCQYPVFDITPEGDSGFSFSVSGSSIMGCAIRLIPAGKNGLPSGISVTMASEGSSDHRSGLPTEEGHLEYYIAGNSRISIKWEAEKPQKGKKVSATPGRGTA